MYEHTVRAITADPWAITPDKLAALCEFINAKLSGADIRYEAAVAPEQRRTRDIAVLPLFGVLAHRANMVTNASGGTSLQKFSRDLSALANDPNIGAIIIDIDSPGGSVTGLEETAAQIAEAVKRKTVIAHANAMAASGAYWLGSQSSELWITPSGQVGSIGVLAMHQDVSQAFESKGVKTTFITAGRYKAEGAPEQPLTEEARDYMQERVDQYYDSFVKAVARGRHVSEKEVRNGFGQGRAVGAQQALRSGMVDGIGTLENVVDRIARGQITGNGKRARLQAPAVAAKDDDARLFWARQQYESANGDDAVENARFFWTREQYER